MYVYVCMYVFVCMYVCMHACMHVCMYVCMFVYTRICTNTSMQSFTYHSRIIHASSPHTALHHTPFPPPHFTPLSASSLSQLYATYALWALYQACYIRIRVLSHHVDEKEHQSSGAIEAWWSVRQFYSQIMFPIIYQMSHIWLVLNLIFLVVMTAYDFIA